MSEENNHEITSKKKKTYGEEEDNYVKALTYLVLTIIGISIAMWGLSKVVDNKPPTTTRTAESGEKKENVVRQNPYQYDRQGQHYEDKNKDNPLKSKDSSEAILAKVAHKILAITGDPETECSMPIFDSPKQYWVTECDYKDSKTKETLHQKFSINLDQVEKIN